jgi:pimeloyl-ACP methyl ester carboxylesterase
MVHIVSPPHGGSFPVTDIGPERESEALPLVLVPGVGGPRDTYHHQIEEFRRDRRVVATNLNAVRARATTAIDSAARDVLAAMDALGIERADILGSSFGSTAVARLSQLAPGRVGRMVWVAPPVVRHAPWRRIFGPGWLFGGALLRYSPPRYHAPVARFVFERRIYSPEPELSAYELELLAKRVSDTQLGPFVGRILDLKDWDWRKQPGDVRHPLLVMQGRREHALTPPDILAAWEQAGGRAVTVTPGHHMPYLSFPLEFNAALRSFLDEPQSAH